MPGTRIRYRLSPRQAQVFLEHYALIQALDGEPQTAACEDQCRHVLRCLRDGGLQLEGLILLEHFESGTGILTFTVQPTPQPAHFSGG